jgi:hypothetical protein
MPLGISSRCSRLDPDLGHRPLGGRRWSTNQPPAPVRSEERGPPPRDSVPPPPQSRRRPFTAATPAAGNSSASPFLPFLAATTGRAAASYARVFVGPCAGDEYPPGTPFHSIPFPSRCRNRVPQSQISTFIRIWPSYYKYTYVFIVHLYWIYPWTSRGKSNMTIPAHLIISSVCLTHCRFPTNGGPKYGNIIFTMLFLNNTKRKGSQVSRQLLFSHICVKTSYAHVDTAPILPYWCMVKVSFEL